MKDKSESNYVSASELKSTTFDSVLLIVGALMFASMLFLAVLQVFVRVLAPVTGFVLPWTEEAARFLLILTTFLGTAVAMRKNEHITISTIVDRMKLKTKLFLEIVVLLLAIIFIVLVGQGSYIMMQQTAITPTGSIPWLRVGQVYAMMMVAIIFTGIYALKWLCIRIPEYIIMLKSAQTSNTNK